MKKAFTLVEIIIAIAIFSVIIVYMYQAIGTTKKSTAAYERKYEKIQKNQTIRKLLYNDIFNQVDPYSDTKVDTSGDFSTYYLKTNNSLHNISSPFVAYKVIKNTLYRFESIRKFTLPINEDNKNSIHVDKLLENIKSFLLYTYKNSKLIQWNVNDEQTIFEIALPYSKKVLIVESGNESNSESNNSKDTNSSKKQK